MGPLVKVAASRSTLVPNLRSRWLGFLAAGTTLQTGHGAHGTHRQTEHDGQTHYLGDLWTTDGYAYERVSFLVCLLVFCPSCPFLVLRRADFHTIHVHVHIHIHTQQRTHLEMGSGHGLTQCTPSPKDAA